MTPSFLVSFLGLGFLYALLTSTLVSGAAALIGGASRWRVFPFLLATFFFIFLTLHPFPDPATLTCPVPMTEPQLKPFDFIRFLAEVPARSGARWYTSKMFGSVVMNFALCGLIGALLVRHTQKLGMALLLGIALPLLVELTQLTGIWGLYPCAYRQFDVDDLILNFAGIVIGFLSARGLFSRWLPYPR